MDDEDFGVDDMAHLGTQGRIGRLRMRTHRDGVIGRRINVVNVGLKPKVNVCERIAAGCCDSGLKMCWSRSVGVGDQS